jgi:hypothetical protein
VQLTEGDLERAVGIEPELDFAPHPDLPKFAYEWIVLKKSG